MSGVPVPVCSTREIARSTGIPKISIFRILLGMLQLYPYKLQLVQKLLPDNAVKIMAFASWALSEFEENTRWLLSILWTKGAHFSLHGTVNAHNCEICAKENPRAYTEVDRVRLEQRSVLLQTHTQRTLHGTHITAWCGFTSEIIVGSFFLSRTFCKIRLVDMFSQRKKLSRNATR